MRRALMIALVGTAFTAVPTAPAQAALVLIGTFSGNQCTGVGAISNCYASGTTAGTGVLDDAPPGSPGIVRLEDTGTAGGLTTSLLTGDVLSYSYTGSIVAHYMGLFNGGSAVGCTPGQNCYNNTYFLFYSADPITSGTIPLSTLFQNAGISHVDLFDTGGVPEPATWAMMLLGFGGIGMALRRARKADVEMRQLA